LLQSQHLEIRGRGDEPGKNINVNKEFRGGWNHSYWRRSIRARRYLNLPKGIILFSGYSFDEINNCSLRDCFNFIDVLIDGKFEESFKITNGLRGSSNQNIISFSNKIFEEEISIDHEIEISMLEEQIFLTGFPKLDKKYLKELGVIV